MLTGCPLEVYQVELYIRKCPVSNPNFCYHSDVVRDSNPSRSVKYKPKPEDLTWLYHGLFVNGEFREVKQGSHRLEKYLNIQECLEKSLKIKFALKST